uniref:DNA mismatch repair protein MSH2 n=1 Tax=Timema monikensis TaxID=170555 RepID=A0A7R9E477_9NEOP|nr:unnamed protein product [Timema monikensis]
MCLAPGGLFQKPSTTVRLFNRGDYYTAHGSDALFAAKEVFKSAGVVKMIGAEGKQIQSLVLNKLSFESFVRNLLLVKQYRVEIYVNKGTSKFNDWVVEYKGSPGNLTQFEDLLFSMDVVLSSSVIAVKIGRDTKNKVVGVGFVDVSERRLCVCEFSDDDHFSNLETLVVQVGPKECLLPGTNGSQEFVTIKKVVERSGVLVTPRKKTEFSTDGLAQDLNRLIAFKKGQQENAMAMPETNLTTAVCALNAIIKFLELTTDSSNFNQFSLSTMNWSQYVHLDSAAVKALSLIPPPGVTTTQAHHSVIGLMDRCKTPQGHRLLAQWMKQPLRDLNTIVERQEIVRALMDDLEARQALTQEHLRRIPDIQALARRLLKKKVTMQDLYRIYQVVKKLPQLVKCLDTPDQSATLINVLVEPLKELLTDMLKFQEMIESTIDMDLVDRGEFLVKPDFDEDLQEMRNSMNSIEDQIKKLLSRVASDLNLEAGKTLKLESNNQLGYFFRVTLKEEKVLRDNKKYQTLDTNKSGVRFRNSALADLNSDYQHHKEQYSEQQKAIVAEIIGIAAGYVSTLHYLNDVLARLDVLTSFAEVAATAPKPYVRPIIKSDGLRVMRLKGVRHACLEVQDGVSFIANDAEFIEDEQTFHIITGPNMGGKSTYIRSVGIVVLLAQVGSFVPCDEAEMTLVDAILARVGADDCQVKGMSTFMMEMVETSAILRKATCHSLVIIDELGRGTSTFEGCGLAWAIAEYLAKEVKAFCLFATHFHELATLADEVPSVVNKHVSALIVNNTLTLLYRVRPGMCDQSYGIYVAKMAKFPASVIQMAHEKQSELEHYKNFDFDGTAEERNKIIEDVVTMGDVNPYMVSGRYSVVASYRDCCWSYFGEGDVENIYPMNWYLSNLNRELSWLAARVWLISQSKASICQDSSDAMVPASEVVGLRLNRTSFRGLVIGLCLPNWVRDGEQIIAEFVSSCKGLKDIHSDTELNIRLKELQCRVKASSNLYVQALLASLPS